MKSIIWVKKKVCLNFPNSGLDNMFAHTNMLGLNSASKFVISEINFSARKKNCQNCIEQNRLCTRTSVHEGCHVYGVTKDGAWIGIQIY
jgi:hypothetical protein